MNALILLLAFSIFLIAKVRCSNDPSSPELLLSTIASRNDTSINRKDSNDKTFHDFQSNLTLEYQKQREQSCNIEANVSEELGIFKFRFQGNSTFFKCNFSRPMHLNYNGVDNLNPHILDQLKKLAELLLEYNKLDSLNVTISQGSNFLETLEIDMNNLFTLPIEIFRELVDLETIKLNANNFSNVPANLFVHNIRIKTIELTQNKLGLKDLPPRLFSDFADLQFVLLRGNGLQQLTDDLFWGSHNLKELDLSKNYLRVLPKDLLRDARELRILNVSSNYLTNLPDGIFIAAKQLNQLDLSANYIAALNSSDVFAGLENLQMLKMERNGLKFIHAEAFAPLLNLKYANFAHNLLNLTTGNYDHFGQMSPFRHCHLLEELYLSYNSISKVFEDWLVIHNALRKLDLSYNEFTYIEAKDMRFNSNNLFVDLTENWIKIVNLTELGKIPKTANNSRDVVIDLNSNRIDCYCDVHSLVRYIMNETSAWLKPEDFNYVKLKTDDLFCYEPPNLMGVSLDQLSGKALACGYKHGRPTSCASVDGCFCDIIPKFNTFSLYCNEQNLTEAPSWIYNWHIKSAYVNFSGNALQKTPDVRKGGYESPDELYLDLSRNEISLIEEYSVGANLREFNLAYNNLSRIDMGIVRFMAFETSKLKMRIRENPWPCNYQIRRFQSFSRHLFDTIGFWKDWDMKEFTCNDTTMSFSIRK